MFAWNTINVWDRYNEKEEDFSSPSFQTLNSKDALATTAQVLENHSKLKIKPEQSQSTASLPSNCKVRNVEHDAHLPQTLVTQA
jgi:hypothetical protein